jgi:hypothetical protein
MARVYRAYDPMLGRLVALKLIVLLPSQHINSQRPVESLQRTSISVLRLPIFRMPFEWACISSDRLLRQVGSSRPMTPGCSSTWPKARSPIHTPIRSLSRLAVEVKLSCVLHPSIGFVSPQDLMLAVDNETGTVMIKDFEENSFSRLVESPAS